MVWFGLPLFIQLNSINPTTYKTTLMNLRLQEVDSPPINYLIHNLALYIMYQEANPISIIQSFTRDIHNFVKALHQNSTFKLANCAQSSMQHTSWLHQENSELWDLPSSSIFMYLVKHHLWVSRMVD